MSKKRGKRSVRSISRKHTTKKRSVKVTKRTKKKSKNSKQNKTKVFTGVGFALLIAVILTVSMKIISRFINGSTAEIANTHSILTSGSVSSSFWYLITIIFFLAVFYMIRKSKTLRRKLSWFGGIGLAFLLSIIFWVIFTLVTRTPGERLSVFPTEFGPVGILICRDMLYPHLSQQLSQKDAKIIFCPAFWSYSSLAYFEEENNLENDYPPQAEFTTLKHLPITRAIENETFFIVANAGGSTVGKGCNEKLAGHSVIAAPLHGCLASLSHMGESHLIHELNMSILEDSKKTYSVIDTVPNHNIY